MRSVSQTTSTCVPNTYAQPFIDPVSNEMVSNQEQDAAVLEPTFGGGSRKRSLLLGQ
jgi:hypothetical protein